MKDYSGNSNEVALTDNDLISFIHRVVEYQDGVLGEKELADLEGELLSSEEKLKIFVEVQMRSTEIHNLLRQSVYGDFAHTPLNALEQATNSNSTRERFSIYGSKVLAISLALAAGLFLAIGLPVVIVQKGSIATTNKDASSSRSVAGDVSARMVGASRATFFGGLVPEIESLLTTRREYVLTSGLVELLFPTGATVIVEGPAVFRVLGKETLAMEAGRCSVHAPDGAEGFRVETPMSRIVDRGTRFTVAVSENCETEVQVVEGAADVYRKSDQIVDRELLDLRGTDRSNTEASLPLQARLVDRDARRFTSLDTATIVPIEFTDTEYRRQLPDRIVRYDATRSTLGGVESLESVSVQRGGVVRDYIAESLIPVEITWFKSNPIADSNGHLMGGLSLPDHRKNWLGDLYLNTGVINPGGQNAPLQSAPVINSSDESLNPSTPGFAVRFKEPVTNSLGPDVVFFELQTMTNNPNGDPFHVSPMSFVKDRRSCTVRAYDLNLASPESLPLDPFYLYRCSDPISSLAQLENVSFDRTPMRKSFRVLAVGIDLSDLGYSSGEMVHELFFQDADENEQRVDPVLIAGLPTVEKGGVQKGD